MLGDDGDQIVAQFLGTKILPSKHAACNLEACGLKEPYCDPLLRSRPRYEDFVRRLLDAGMVDFSMDRGTERVEFFFVAKSSGGLRS